jgi:hypothetical protein
MEIDFKQVEDLEDLRAVPDGEYTCRIAEIRESRSPAGHIRWGLRWEVALGDWQGRTACWDSLHWSERGLPRLKYVLRILGFDVSGELSVQATDLENRRALVSCTSEEREDPVSGIRRLLNRVPFAGYRPLPADAEAAARARSNGKKAGGKNKAAEA